MSFQIGGIPSTRWIVNFDRDLLDGLVLAAQLASYCPYLVRMFFNILMEAFATDICDPNPILMLMLCVYLYERLPQYLPKKSVEFPGPLHATVLRKVQIFLL
ncbi:hypothetical protein JD844_032548 [Phrynosoma platyrhinos]|uniref:Uncharacterized protein n=1 Tax=Phrynosoma platyrhinos TaxID=52577 RepID=A0ABQ7T5H8_PHRPL|nr:hypothetical protein JD844_032548 [Phrynosoma platyrhinos]